MTPRERVLTAMRRQQPDRVPRRLEYSSFVASTMAVFRQKTGAVDPEEYFAYEIRNLSFRPTQRREGLARYLPKVIPENTAIDWEWGNLLQKGHHDNISQVVHYALANAETAEDIAAYPMPDLLAPYRWQHVAPGVQQLHARDLAVMGFMSQTLFEAAWGVRGFENLLMDFYINPELVEALLDRLTEIRVRQAVLFAQAGVDVLRLGDDVGTERGMLISPAIFREWLKPRLARIIRAAREVRPDILVFFHSDGDCREVIEDLIEIGVDILNPVQPECMDPAEIKALYGDRLAFWGTVGTQTTMPFGTPEEVRQVVRERIETVGAGGGLLLAPTHMLQAEVPWENILAFFSAVDEYGTY